MSLILTLKRTKHKILGHRQLVTYGTGNKSVLYPSLWYLFFDVDSHDKEVYEFVRDHVQYWYEKNWFSLTTKHGFAVIATIAKPLSEVKGQFDHLKGVVKTDYEWGLPLWIRLTPKWDLQGNEVSPAPELNENPSGIKDPLLWLQAATMPRKLYYTWD